MLKFIRKMKILQVNSVYKFGSTGKIMLNIHEELLSNSIDSYVAYGRGKKVNNQRSFYIGSKLFTFLNVLFNRLFDIHDLFSYFQTKKLIKIIKKINPSIVHFHNLHGYYLNLRTLFHFLKTKNIKIIFTLHDCWTFTGHCSYFDFIGCSKWQTQCTKCPQISSYPKSYFLDNSKANFINKKEVFLSLKNLTLVSPSKWLMTLLEKSFLKNNDKYLINNGINLSTYKPTIGKNFLNKFNIQNKFIILGVANKWEERKGFSFFLKLSRLISKDFVIVIVGLSKKQELNLPKNIVSIKRTDSIEELVEVYSNSNVLFNPTLEDNFPTVNLESIACGTPVVTFNTGGSGESISSQTGFIVPKGDLNGVISSIENIKKVGKESFATSCREFALKNFDVKITNGKYIELYKNLSNNL